MKRRITIDIRCCWFCYRQFPLEVGYLGDDLCSCGAAKLTSGLLWDDMSDWQKRDAVSAAHGCSPNKAQT